jgi:hypothetical protein
VIAPSSSGSDSTIEGYPESVFDPEDEGDLEVLAEFLAVLG